MGCCCPGKESRPEKKHAFDFKKLTQNTKTPSVFALIYRPRFPPEDLQYSAQWRVTGKNVRVFGFPLPTLLQHPRLLHSAHPPFLPSPRSHPMSSTHPLARINYTSETPFSCSLNIHPPLPFAQQKKKKKNGLLALKWTYRKRRKSLGWYESERRLCGLAGARAAVGRQQHPAFLKVGASLPHTQRCHGDKKFFSAGHGNVCRSEWDTSPKTKKLSSGARALR